MLRTFAVAILILLLGACTIHPETAHSSIGADPNQSDVPERLDNDWPAAKTPSPGNRDLGEGGILNGSSESAETPPKPHETRPLEQRVTRRSIDELFLFFPSKYPDGDWQPEGLDFEDVWFDADDGTRLHGWYCPSDEPRAVVLYSHGNGGNLSDRALMLAFLQKQMRLTVMIYDYRGYGRNAGTPTADGVLCDARAARTALAQRANVPPEAMVLMGRSLGGAVAVQLAAERAARGLILESTFSSMRDVAKEHYQMFAWVVPTRKLDSISAIARYHGPLLQSHGDADRIVPYQLGRKLFDAANQPKQFVTLHGLDHNDPQARDYYIALDRFIEHLPAQEIRTH